MSAFYKKMYDQDMMFGGPRILEGNPEEQKQIEIEIEMGENSESEQELNEKERERSRSKEKETKNLSGDQNHDVKEEDNLIIDSSQKGLNLFVDSQLDEAKQMQVEEAPLTREEKIRQAKERLKLRTATLNNQKPEG